MKSAGIVAVGCSAGGVEALLKLLPSLKKDFPLPVAVVIHQASDSVSILPRLFTDRCELVVKEAEDKEFLSKGTIYFAPPGYHLLYESDYSFSLSVEDPVYFSRPSIDVFFESVAAGTGPSIGVILTGANSDGASGIRQIAAAGGFAFVQDPRDAAQAGMPTAAIEALRAAPSIPQDRIAVLSLEDVILALPAQAARITEAAWKK